MTFFVTVHGSTDSGLVALRYSFQQALQPQHFSCRLQESEVMTYHGLCCLSPVIASPSSFSERASTTEKFEKMRPDFTGANLTLLVCDPSIIRTLVIEFEKRQE